MNKSKTQQVFSEMVNIIKESTDSQSMIRHNEIESKLKALKDFNDGIITQGHINGAFNYLRRHCSDYNINYQRISGGSYFQYLDSKSKIRNKLEIKEQINLKGKSLINELHDMKKDIVTASDFSIIQNTIDQLNKIFK